MFKELILDIKAIRSYLAVRDQTLTLMPMPMLRLVQAETVEVFWEDTVIINKVDINKVDINKVHINKVDINKVDINKVLQTTQYNH